MGKSASMVNDSVAENRLNPCFGGFGWERHRCYKLSVRACKVLILVLVDLGGKDLNGFSYGIVNTMS